jgi:uncharacterized protein YfaS (alpha-2-macroglobulin family)
MAYLVEQGPDLPVILQNEGVGRLYYRMAMDYAPGDLVVPALERGFEVERTFVAMDDPGDVRQDPDGTWRIKTGARVWIRLSISAPAIRHYVALQSPLPAGLEIIDSSLQGRRSIPSDRRSFKWMSGTWAWYGHENLRTDRGEVFADMLYPGHEEYKLPCLATGKGRFITAPAKAEEMYHPDVFGRTGTDIVVIE